MSATKAGVLVALVLVNIAFVIGWIWAVRRHRLHGLPRLPDMAIGALTSFLDTLGIGSFAPTTALFKFRGKPADELIPGTLNVGLNPAAFAETLLFISAVAWGKRGNSSPAETGSPMRRSRPRTWAGL